MRNIFTYLALIALIVFSCRSNEKGDECTECTSQNYISKVITINVKGYVFKKYSSPKVIEKFYSAALKENDIEKISQELTNEKFSHPKAFILFSNQKNDLIDIHQKNIDGYIIMFQI